MQKLISIFLFLSFISLISYIGCDDTVTAEDIDKKDIPDSSVSYSQHIQPVLNIKCASAGCHDDGSRAGGLSLTSWTNTTSDLSVVFPGEPDNSSLVWVIEINVNISHPVFPFLTPDQIKGVRTWIKEGAKNN